MNKLLVFNWKMNPVSFSEAEQLLRKSIILEKKSKKYKIVICPPFTWLNELSRKYSGKISFGAQDVFWENPPTGKGGAYTGEISADMLKNLRVEYVIVGHSERRRYENDTDEMIGKKAESAIRAGLKVILCAGEDLTTHNQGLEAVKNFVKYQLEKDLKRLTENLKPENKNLIVAYEPVWAIGTNMPEEPAKAATMIKYIKEILDSRFQILNSRVLYGGSVDGGNIGGFIEYKEIDGFLVGGASLNPEQFMQT